MNIVTDNLDQIINAPDGIKRLRELILQLAVQGKLVEQRPEEGTAADLLQQIKDAKRKDAEERKARGERVRKQKLLPSIGKGEIPSDIPDGWEWVRVAGVFETVSGNTFKPEFEKENGEVPYVKVGDMNFSGNESVITTSSRFINPDEKMRSSLIPTGSIIFPKRGGAIATNKKRPVSLPIFVDLNTMAIIPSIGVITNYAHAWLESIDLATLNTGTSVPQINHKDIDPLPFPLPPLAEQKRIVEKVDELMAWCDELEALKEKRDTLQRASLKATLRDLTAGSSLQALDNLSALVRSPDDVKQLRDAILQLAVQGRLVEQRESDGTAADLLKEIEAAKAADLQRRKAAGERTRKAKPLPTIGKNEIPFDIPENWEWVRLGNLGMIGSSSRVHQKDWRDSGIPFYRAREIVKLSQNGFVENDLFIDEELYRTLSAKGNIPEEGDVMITGVGTIGVPYVVRPSDRFYFKDASVLIFKNVFELNPLFLQQLFRSPHWNESIHEDSMGTTVHTFTISRANKIMIPLPPLAEQQRIVKKVDELMAWCDELETLLQTESETASGFALSISQRGGGK